MTDVPIPGVPTTITSQGIQLNISGVAAPYTVNMPTGSDIPANPTGVRNIGSTTEIITFNAAPGQFFWDVRTQTQSATVQKIVSPGDSLMYVFRSGIFGWVPYHVDSFRLVELWQATPIIGIGTPSVVQWTFVPLFTGQTPIFYTHSLGVFTYNQAASIDTEVEIRIEMAFDSAGNNTDATYTVDFEEVAAPGATTLFVPIRNSFQTARAGNFPVSGYGSGVVNDPANADTFRVIANEDVSTGAMTVDLEAALLTFTMES